MSRLEFSGRQVVVTGASTGIGRATALLLAERGARLFLIARSSDKLAALAEQIEAAGGQASAHTADVSDKAALLAALDTAEVAAPIEGLFLNAGTGGTFAPLADYEDEAFEAILRTNLHHAFWAMKQVLPLMAARGRGAMLMTGSLASHRGMAMNVGYVASKHAILGLSRAAALEAAPMGVRVNCLIPGFIDTPLLAGIDHSVAAHLAAQVPQGRIGGAEEVAEAAAFLLSDAAGHVTGQSWAVDGGVLGTLAV